MRVGHSSIHVALTGNANVGKSVIFNQLTGLNQFVGNWPGKTVMWAEGRAIFKGIEFRLIDLPGIYSLSTYSLEEVVTRQYLVEKHPDFIICVLNAASLERNLFFLIQLLLLRAAPVIVSLNQWDVAKSRGLNIDFNKLGDILGCPVIPTVAVHGRGVHELLEVILDFDTNSKKYFPLDIRLGKEVEARVSKLEEVLAKIKEPYPSRFIAIKLLENDNEIINYCQKVIPDVIPIAENLKQELEKIHGEEAVAIISAEIYNIVQNIVSKVQTIEHSLEKESMAEKLDHVTTHSVWGYVILIAIMLGIYFGVFTLGGFIADTVDSGYGWISQFVYATWGNENIAVKILWDGTMGGFLGAVGGVLPFVFLFYFFLEILQDSGYLPRATFLMDQVMHRIGLHGKSIIPLIVGFGCNVPGCAACRILETEREKKLTIFVTSFIPCAAVTTVIMGTVGRFMGLGYAFLLYAIDIAVIIVFGQIAGKLMKGEGTELIIELHNFRKPNLNVILKQTWFRGKEFVVRALPLITIIGVFMEILLIFNFLNPINDILAPITVFWLGLPTGAGIFLIYGVLRKELSLVLLSSFILQLGFASIGDYMSPTQLFVFALITLLYIPCIATIIVIGKEAGGKMAAIITFIKIGLAILIGGLINWGSILVQMLMHAIG